MTEHEDSILSAMTNSPNSGPLKPVYAIVGKDRFLRAEALDPILAGGDSTGAESHGARFEGDEASLSEVLDDVRTLSLLGGCRIVVVDDADGFITQHRAVLEKFCHAPAESGCLILLCNSLPKNTKLHKAIAKSGEVIAAEAPRGRGVVTWIVARARGRHGVTIDGAAAQRLRDHLGDSPGLLDAELAKLATYVGDRKCIAAADIDALTGNHREELVFTVIDALAVGNLKSAMTLWEQVLATDLAAPGRAIGGLVYAVRKLLSARRQLESGTNIAVLARMLFTDAGTAERRLNAVSTIQLETQLEDLLAADIAVKTGGSTVDLAVEKFIIKHGSKTRMSA